MNPCISAPKNLLYFSLFILCILFYLGIIIFVSDSFAAFRHVFAEALTRLQFASVADALPSGRPALMNGC